MSGMTNSVFGSIFGPRWGETTKHHPEKGGLVGRGPYLSG
jgi:hypothetical protein